MLKQDLHKIIFLAICAITSILFYLGYKASGDLSFILKFRGQKLFILVIVAIAVSVATVLFQTITHNRIITPAIMGFDALYFLIQISLIFALGGQAFIGINQYAKFMLDIVIMLGFFIAIFHLLFLRANRSIFILALTGIVMGELFRSLSNFMYRLMDPVSFQIMQAEMFASMTKANLDLAYFAGLMTLISCFIAYQLRYKLDVMALGKNNATSLGVDHKMITYISLILIAILVSISTALVGPITFFGLLVAHLSYLMLKNQNHLYLFLASSLFAIILLVFGQLLFDKVFNFQSSISTIIEFFGGIGFLILLLRAYKK